MKKKVKRYLEQIEVGAQNRHNVLKDFAMMLDTQATILNLLTSLCGTSIWKLDFNRLLVWSLSKVCSTYSNLHHKKYIQYFPL